MYKFTTEKNIRSDGETAYTFMVTVPVYIESYDLETMVKFARKNIADGYDVDDSIRCAVHAVVTSFDDDQFYVAMNIEDAIVDIVKEML